ncbi:MAG: GtrA family protein [Acutalibacteraceae bacterium]|nr:GtrA family protein [Oscillospiraceae bacterium]
MKAFYEKHREIILYVVFGVLTTLVNWGSYTFFVRVCSLGVSVSNALSWSASVIFAFLTNKKWVFESTSWKPATLLREGATFLSARALTGAIELICVPWLAKLGFDKPFYSLFNKLGIKIGILYTDGIYSKVVLAIVIVILNYVFSKLIVFRKKQAGAA